MTVAPAISCGVCATPVSTSAERCPSCGAATSTAPATAPSSLPTLLAGCRRAGAMPRALAVGVDVVLALGLALTAILGPERLATAAWVATALYVLLTLIAVAVAGRTIGGLLAGIRTVDLFTGLPLGLGRVVIVWRADGITLDVRRGRDPARTVSHARPVPPRPAPAATGAGSWGPAPAQPAPPHALRPPVSAAPAPGAQPTMRPEPPVPAPAPPAQPVAMVVTTADGGRFTTTGTALLGRNPQPRDAEHVDALVPVNDLQRTVSKTHATLRWDGRTLWVTDRGSTNGTAVTDPAGTWRRLTPRVELPLEPGSTVHLGDQPVTVTTTAEGDPR
ncbi:FHA domain-containing protein [Georgenia sp. MJ170]|uniref:FHA domain-containing protein n=1 Tax=Georgenia sunbinii TaxID=3117728 RepID=UPI002F26BDAF